MQLEDLNNELLLEQSFYKINRTLSKYLDKLEDDAKEVNLNVVNLLVKKAEKFLNDLDEKLKDKNVSILELDDLMAKYKKPLLFFKKRFEALVEQYSDNEFQQEIMSEVIQLLNKLVIRIDTSLSGFEDEIKRKIKATAQEVSLQTSQKGKGIKIPHGLAQDLYSKKHYIHKEKK